MQPPRQPIQQQMQHFQSPSPMAPQGPPGTPQNSAAAAAAASDDKNVTKCVRFLKTLINLSNNDDPEMPDKAARVKELIRVRNWAKNAIKTGQIRIFQGVIYLETTAEEFTRNLQQVLKSQAQPHLLPFLQNTLPALRNAVRNGSVLCAKKLKSTKKNHRKTGKFELKSSEKLEFNIKNCKKSVELHFSRNCVEIPWKKFKISTFFGYF